MAEDSNSPQSSHQEVDLDSLEVDILIIARNPKMLQATASFLTRRQWNVTVTADVAKAVSAIAEQRPDFILASFNHTSPAIARLPELMADAVGVSCVGFTEVIDTASTARLQQSKYPYKLLGQSSGPSVHRYIRKLLAEKFGMNEEGKRPEKSAASTAGKGDIHIQQSVKGPSEGGTHTIRGEKEVLSTGKYTMTKDTRQSLKQMMRFGAEGGATEGSATQEGGGALLEKLRRSLIDEGAGKGDPKVEGTVNPSEQLEKMVEGALGDVCDMQAADADRVLNRVTRVGVFPVKSSTAPGYLVMASAMDERQSDEFFRMVEVELQKSFAALGVTGKLEPGFSVTLPETEFGAWSARRAAFTLVLAHGGFEVGAAFFRTQEPLPEVRDTGRDGMLSVNIRSISTRHPVAFKAYLHMKKNNKYFLYLRNGRTLQPEQKERLHESDVRDFFMKSVDRDNIRMFLAAVFLRETLKEDDEAA